jgi:hypothetical protein
MTAGDDIRAEPSGLPPGRAVAAAGPLLLTTSPLTAGTGLILFPEPGRCPRRGPARCPRAGWSPAR